MKDFQICTYSLIPILPLGTIIFGRGNIIAEWWLDMISNVLGMDYYERIWLNGLQQFYCVYANTWTLSQWDKAVLEQIPAERCPKVE